MEEFILECFPNHEISDLQSLLSENSDVSSIIAKILGEEEQWNIPHERNDISNDLKVAQILEIFPDLDTVFIEYFLDYYEDLEIDEIICEISYYLSNRSHRLFKRKRPKGVPLSEFLGENVANDSLTGKEQISFRDAVQRSTPTGRNPGIKATFFDQVASILNLVKQPGGSADAYRTLAAELYAQRCDLLRKASRAYSHRQRPIASYYAQEAAILYEKIDNANKNAAFLTFKEL